MSIPAVIAIGEDEAEERLAQSANSYWLVEDEMVNGYEDEWILAAEQPAYRRVKRSASGNFPQRIDPVGVDPAAESAIAGSVDATALGPADDPIVSARDAP